MVKLMKYACWIVLVFLAMPIVAQEDPFQRLDDKFEELVDWQEQSHKDYLARQDANYKAWVNRIESKWQRFVDSDRTTYVEYSDDLNSRSDVDYDNGLLRIEILVRRDDPDPGQTARDRGREHFQSLFQPNDDSGEEPLEDQILFRPDDEETVDRDNATQFYDQNTGNNLQPADNFTSRDGVGRIRYRLEVPFVQNHVVRRAKEYIPIVVKYCEELKLPPKLVLAIIYAESAFNPMAKSHADAYGLMQLIPRWGARDAYRFLFNEDRMVSPEYLYNPENNIQLGCGYLHVLLYKEWKVEPVWEKSRALSICSYNWGPHNVRKKVYKRHNGDTASYDELYRLLRNHTPEETSNYLERVLSRMSYFDVFFEEG